MVALKVRTRLRAKKQKKLSDFEVFQSFNDAVSAEYWKDSCKAGLVTSTIGHESPLYYVAVARYPNGQMSKQIITSAKAETLVAALRECSRNWLNIVYPPPAADLKKHLRDGL